MDKTESTHKESQKLRDFLDLSRRSIAGSFLGIPLGMLFDSLGQIGNPFAEGIVRLVAGASDSIAEVISILRKRSKGDRSKAGVYVTGKVVGMFLDPIALIFLHTKGKSLGLQGKMFEQFYRWPAKSYNIVFSQDFIYNPSLCKVLKYLYLKSNGQKLKLKVN